MWEIMVRSDHVSKLIAWGLIFLWGQILGWIAYRVDRRVSGSRSESSERLGCSPSCSAGGCSCFPGSS